MSFTLLLLWLSILVDSEHHSGSFSSYLRHLCSLSFSLSHTRARTHTHTHTNALHLGPHDHQVEKGQGHCFPPKHTCPLLRGLCALPAEHDVICSCLHPSQGRSHSWIPGRPSLLICQWSHVLLSHVCTSEVPTPREEGGEHVTHSVPRWQSAWGGQDLGTWRRGSFRASKVGGVSKGFGERKASVGAPGGAMPGSRYCAGECKGAGCVHRGPQRGRALERQLEATPGKT